MMRPGPIRAMSGWRALTILILLLLGASRAGAQPAAYPAPVERGGLVDDVLDLRGAPAQHHDRGTGGITRGDER